MRTIRVWLMVVISSTCGAQAVRRPAITGFSHVAFYAKSPEATRDFYTHLLGLPQAERPNVYAVGRQTIEVEPGVPPSAPSLLAHIGFATDDAEGMRRYLAAHGVDVPPSVHVEPSGTRWFSVKDPEGTPLEFVQDKRKAAPAADAVSSQIIHVGFLVHDRENEDRFYRDLLGFRLYWQGGMQDGHTDFVAMQVPEGRQWIEYMLVHGNATPDARQLGVMNHYSLGVSDMQEAAKFLAARGWTPSGGSKVQMGRDGKWQLNVYDPDGTRVELMEFTPKQTPCCAPFTAPHPGRRAAPRSLRRIRGRSRSSPATASYLTSFIASSVP